MASRFASVTEKQISLINETAVPKKKNMETTEVSFDCVLMYLNLMCSISPNSNLKE